MCTIVEKLALNILVYLKIVDPNFSVQGHHLSKSIQDQVSKNPIDELFSILLVSCTGDIRHGL